jgi:SagB-type dehydrogenase family enzyme
MIARPMVRAGVRWERSDGQLAFYRGSQLLARLPVPDSNQELLAFLRRRMLVDYVVDLPTGRLRIRPHSAAYEPTPVASEPGVRYRLPRHALLRRVDDWLLLERPDSPASIFFEDGSIGVVAALLAGALVVEPDPLAIAGLLAGAGLIEKENEEDPNAWEFHDFLFHTGSAAPRGPEPYGATWRMDAGPPVKPPMSDQRILLTTPALANDPPFAQVVESRHSAQAPGPTPPTLDQLAELLFRMSRNLPGAGGRRALEFYAALERCGGAERGLYHYRPSEHAFERLPVNSDFENLLDGARSCWGTRAGRPDALIILTARYARMAGKYERIAYRNLLLDTGIAIEALYLAAVASGLAGCALGWNDPALFARVSGVDGIEEPSLALFAVTALQRSSEHRA